MHIYVFNMQENIKNDKKKKPVRKRRKREQTILLSDTIQ